MKKNINHYCFKIKHNSGFSLLELLLYISLLSTIMVIISTTFISFNRGRGQVETRVEVNSALNFSIDKISQDLRAASAVSTPGTASLNSDNLEMTVSGSPIKYCVQSGQLRRETTIAACSASSEAITPSAVTMGTPTFTRLENTNSILNKTAVSIEISLIASYNSASPDWQYQESKKTTVSLR